MNISAILVFMGMLLNISYLKLHYDEKRGKSAVNYAIAAYCSYETIDSWNCGAPCSNNTGVRSVTRIHYHDDDTFAFVAFNSEKNEIVLSFRGTNGADLLNWLTNMDSFQVPYKEVEKAKVHRGFYQAYEAVAEEVRTTVEEYLNVYPRANLMITGHSLGGALATLAAIDIMREIKPKNQVYFYTFGSPRVGNKYFSDYIFSFFPDGKYSRVTHYDDTFVHQPPTITGYMHAGNEIWYGDGYSMEYKECENNPGQDSENTECSHSLFIPVGLESHLIYVGTTTASCNQDQPTGTLKTQLRTEVQAKKAEIIKEDYALAPRKFLGSIFQNINNDKP